MHNYTTLLHMVSKKSLYLESHQIETIETMVEQDKADTESEALRILLNSGMVEHGYRAGRNGNTLLKTFTRRLAWAFALIGIVWMATTLFMPVLVLRPAFAAMSASLGMFGLHRVLDEHEPAITNRLRALTGGEPA